jgi:formyltetrahydrofolate synthetase
MSNGKDAILPIGEIARKVGLGDDDVETYGHFTGKVIEAAGRARLDTVKPLYSPRTAVDGKINIVAKEIYGASAVHFESTAARKLEKFSALGFAELADYDRRNTFE